MQEIRVGGMDVVFAPPGVSGPAPGVVVVHELFGLNSDIRSITGRIRDWGYAVAAPDLYSDGFRPLCIARTVRDAFGSGHEGANRLDEVRRWLVGRDDVQDDRVGVIGFCMGAGLAVVAAASHPYRVASVNYGEVPEGADALADICPVVGSYGGQDRRLLPSAHRLRAALAVRGVPHDVEIYPAAGHSFLNQAAPAVFRRFGVGYEPSAAADAWARIERFFAEHLRDERTTGSP